MAKYLVLIYGDEQVYADGGPALMGEVMQGHGAFGTKHAAKILGGNALAEVATATSIRKDGDRVTVTDGPFVETKEALGGYYLIDADDLDEAVAIASDIPSPGGGLEVRPVMVFD